MELTVGNLARYLSARYPQRRPDDSGVLEQLVEELRLDGHSSVDEVHDMLTRTNDAFLAQEREGGPAGGFTRVGAVRVSVGIDHELSRAAGAPVRPRSVMVEVNGLRLTPGNLSDYLNSRYPERLPGHMEDIEELVEELEAAGYTLIDEVNDMLNRTNAAFLSQEQERAPGDEFIGIGVVRVSLEIDQP